MNFSAGTEGLMLPLLLDGFIERLRSECGCSQPEEESCEDEGATFFPASILQLKFVKCGASVGLNARVLDLGLPDMTTRGLWASVYRYSDAATARAYLPYSRCLMHSKNPVLAGIAHKSTPPIK
ncbi:unnamed protein product [Gongylonema pulchrum]|uniref:SET domain-containing protein n=1 Tax=Gongylonema pulchrum TaxID=637853 RepID=A0A183DRP5_9BILA|nr:unnamed protein product [Gongylonema pulchrum]